MHYAIIVAAGSGSRMQSSTNKALLMLGGKPLFAWSLQAFCDSPCIGGIILAVQAREKQLFLPHIKESGKRILLAEGGRTRQETVQKALAVLPEDAETVLVHDAARPFLSGGLIRRVWESVQQFGSGIAALPVADTIKRARDGLVTDTPPRAELYAVQTPQGFRARALREVHRQNILNATDDAALMEAAGFPVHLVEGDELCFKITTPLDMAFAQYVAQQKEAAYHENRLRL